MKKKNTDYKPIFYKSQESLDIPLNELLEQLRLDIHKIRGKIYDIKSTYGWDDRFEHIEGGLTCILVAMHATAQEIKAFELKSKT